MFQSMADLSMVDPNLQMRLKSAVMITSFGMAFSPIVIRAAHHQAADSPSGVPERALVGAGKEYPATESPRSAWHNPEKK